MRINPKFANQQYLYANGDTASALPEGTYSNLAASKYIKDNDTNKDKCLTSDEVTLSKEAFDKLDADKNGKIDLKEMKDALKGQDAAIQAYYSKKASNRSTSDIASSLVGGSADSLADIYANLASAKYIKENDKDKNGTLSSDETTLSKEAFDRLDLDKNGELSQEEIRAGLEGQESTVEAFYKDHTTSSNVSATLAELLEKAPVQTTGKYSTMAATSYVTSKDTDNDGSLSRAEAALSTTSFDKLDTDKSGKLSQAEVQAALKAKEEAFAVYYKNNVSSRTMAGLTSGLLKTI
jgi:Ca2+-binding EF-hand superfamily protein